MLNVQNYLLIRIAHQNNESKRSIAKRLRHSQRKVAEVIASETGVPVPYARSKPRVYPKLGGFMARIDEILLADESAPPKQRHTAMQVYRRLVKEDGYRGKYDQVRRYVNKHRRDRRETILPLDHPAGERIECDFGQIAVDYPDGRRTKDVLIVTWSFSHAVFMIATPNQRTESVLHGMVEAFEFFGCCAREVWWDNPRTIATAVLSGRERKLNDDYAALASHYRFDPRACMPRKGQEKPDAESGVKALKRRACTPVPQVTDDEELNAHLLAFCREERHRTVSGQTQTIGQRFEIDKRDAIELPTHRFDPCISKSVLVDKYQTAMFEHNRYSVPKWSAFLSATVKAYVDRIEIVQDGRMIATHHRSYERDRWIVEPLHYVAALSVRPHALNHSRVFKDWVLPAVFNELRQRLEREHGLNAGIRQYIRVLQLLTTHPATRVADAIRRLWHRAHLRSEDIQANAEQIAGRRDAPVIGGDLPVSSVQESARGKTTRPAAQETEAAAHQLVGAGKNGVTTGACRPTPHPLIQVPRPDLRRFNQLLSSYQPKLEGLALEGDSTDERNDIQPHPTTTAEAQSEGAAIAHDAHRA
jgi:transposase